MKKRIVTTILIISIFSAINSSFNPLKVSAQSIDIITYKKMEEILLRDSTEIKNIKTSLYERRKNYENALKKEIDEEIWNASDSYRRMLLLKTVELTPLQMEHALLSTEDQLQSTKNKLILDLRGKYQSLLSANQNLNIKKMIYESDLKANELNKVKYSNNLISQLELEESEYNLFSNLTEFNIAKRNYEIACRNINLFIRQPIEINYTKLDYELLNDQDIYYLNYYVEKALKNRQEIKSIQRDINIKFAQKELIEKNNVHITYTSVTKEHESLISSINMLELQLQKTKLDITKEITDLYYNVFDAYNQIQRAEKKLDGLKAKLYLTEAKVKAGVLPGSRSDQVKLEIKQAEYEVLNTIFNYNTSLVQLNNAAVVYE